MLITTSAQMLTTIRSRRRALGMSQQTLADRVDVSRQWLSAVETGKASPTLHLLLWLLDALDLDIEVTPRGETSSRGTDAESSASGSGRAARALRQVRGVRPGT